MNTHQHSVSASEIKRWVEENAYQMDNPGVIALQEQTSVIRDWNEEPYKSDLKFCIASPVEYSAVISNLGMSILYQEINQDGIHPTTSGVLCERAYFPEKKLLTRLQKKGWPLFSKETFQPLCNFDVLAFSSYYPLQYFNFPRMLEMSNIPAWSKDRDGKNAPIIMGGGISFYNPEPVSDFFDCFFIGEGEGKLHQVLLIAKECITEDGNIDKERYLYRLASETDFMYVPSYYEVKYFDGFGVKERTSKIKEAKPVIRRALANIYDIKPLTRTFVPVCDSADMSISSVEISRGCSASCNFPISADTPIVINGKQDVLKNVKIGDKVKDGSSQVIVSQIYYRGSTLCVKITAGKLSIISDLTHPFKALDYLSNKFFFVKAGDITNNHILVVSSDEIKTDRFIWDRLSQNIKDIAKERGYAFVKPDLIEEVGFYNTMCIGVETELHEFEAAGFIVHNCEGSARTMPLRERPLDVSLEAFDQVHKETGCFDTTPYGFNLSDHTNIREMLNYLSQNQDVKIQMSSQRIDMFTEDFASLAYATGNRSVTLAVEAGSERMRRAINKNLTAQQILEAFEIAMKIGFNKVKIYMIANLPFERSEDIDGTPSQLISEKYEGSFEYKDQDACQIIFESGKTLIVSKNYVFQKQLGESVAELLKEGSEVIVDGDIEKVKSIMSTTTTLYGPEKKEEDSLVGLMKKLAVRRDYWKQQHAGKETVLNWSFTPFTSKNLTPFEYASCMGGLTNRKTLTPAVNAARELGFKFRVGTASDVSTVAQVLTLGDRRLNNVIYRAYKEGIIQYFGGMGIGSDVLPKFEALLKEETGHDYEIYGQEKELFVSFPWDFLDVGFTKEHRQERYLEAKAAVNSPFGCFVRCVSCGACMTSQENLPHNSIQDETKNFEII